MTIIGPTRLIMIRAGKYDYGEVELVRPLHLVGPNNVGKTSLIAALQFLYIDDQRQMHFSREMDETRRYYFPDPNSYILFECLTPAGYQVVGAQGLGPMKRYEFRRFAYQGTFNPEDFIDDQRRVRPEEDVRAGLADRGYTILEPQHIRAALTGIGDGRGINLGLVPIRNRDHYLRFRRVFCNLLRLSHLSQEELKRFLMDIYEAEFRQPVIDLEQGYSAQYEKVRRQAQEVRDLQGIADDVRQALALAAERDRLRGGLPVLYAAVAQALAQLRAEASRERAEIMLRRERLAAEDAGASGRMEELQALVSAGDERLGVLKSELGKLAQEADDFRDYTPALEDASLGHLRAEIEEIALRLRDAQREAPERVKGRIAAAERELAGQKTMLEGIARSAAVRLRGLVDDAGLAELFCLFNPAMLGLATGHDGIEFLDEARLRAMAEGILGRIDGGRYQDEAVGIFLSVLQPPDMGAYTDPAVISARIEDLESTLKRDRAVLKAAEEAEMLRRQRAELEKESESRQRRRLRFEAWQERRVHVGEWQREHDDLLRQRSGHKAEAGALMARRNGIADEMRSVQDRLAELDRRLEQMVRRVQALSPPDPDWPGGGEIEIPREMDDMVRLFAELRERERRHAERVGDRLHAVEARTYGKYRRATEAETLGLLAEELDGLEKKQEALERLWSGMAAGLRQAFKGLLKDLETLRSRVDELNRQLAGVSVSNLSRLRLDLSEDPQWIGQMKTVTEEEDLPLFADPRETEKALGRLGELLQRCRKLELQQLFDLHFEITAPDGNIRRYARLEAVESNGTTITIKVLVNLMLLRGLLDERKEASIPFYLDEASSLDRDNLLAIVAQSRRMGFAPVLASPEAMDAADHLYFLRERGGRILLEPKSALVRIHRKEGIERADDGG